MKTVLFIDLYCERTAAGFWNEPINALSNVAFLIAAYFALTVAIRRPRRDWAEIIVCLMAGAIGIESFLFHTMATPWSERADVIAIWSFVAAFVLLIIYRSTKENLVRTARIAGIAALITAGVFWVTSGDVTTEAENTVGPLNGSLQYLPALIALLAFSVITWRRQHPAKGYVIGACLVFLTSLMFRSLDLSLCAATGIGTHFMWHMLNGLMVGVLLQALVIHFPPKSA
ncbi:ceramidase domain-containing protein [Cognatishimia sp. WU-CL00825]|uniref:ceramidase domain-containing protein n=1 Tax=Cognatishimia sp. WU-CL00825 TaxID=3127658 RepID=UPI003103B338